MSTGLYIHVPFCETKCGYCDFYSVPLGDRETSRLTGALVDELDRRLPDVAGRFETIFAGGGTPTLLPLGDMERLFGRLAEVAGTHDVVEFTTEANPATVDKDKIRLLVRSGVNRISFGGQSFDQAELDVLERLHHPADIEPGIRLARTGGIAQVNLDLIFGIPGQTLESWRESLQQAIDLETDHLSCYGLTYEPDTPLTGRLRDGRIKPCDEQLELEMYLLCVEVLSAHGFEQYEISNYARPGCQCLHNLIYWNNEPYLGIGPSATSYIDGLRFKNVPHIASYVDDIENRRPPWREREHLKGPDLAGETMMLQLRLNRGIDIAAFEHRVGLSPLDHFHEPLQEHLRGGNLEIGAGFIRLTDKGRLIADRVIADLYCVQPRKARFEAPHVPLPVVKP